jgi:hypothetical protein
MKSDEWPRKKHSKIQMTRRLTKQFVIFSDLVADLVQMPVYRPFIRHVLSLPAGEWVDVNTACQDLKSFTDSWDSLIKVSQRQIRDGTFGDMVVTWIQNPFGEDNVYLFFCYKPISRATRST